MNSPGIGELRVRGESLVLYWASPAAYGLRPTTRGADILGGVMSCRSAVQDPISISEYDELTALRKAQAWGTPMFQPFHPLYAKTLTRLSELESKIRGLGKSTPGARFGDQRPETVSWSDLLGAVHLFQGESPTISPNCI